LGLSLAGALLFSSTSHAATTDAQLAFFETHIRPVLVETCYPCHSAESGKSKGDLLVDSAAGLLRGGGSGPALSPGYPEESLLLTAISYHDSDMRMPPEEKDRLDDQVVTNFRRWIAMGAPDPRGDHTEAVHTTEALDLTRAQEHWAYRPLHKPALPEGSGQAIDRFVASQLTKAGIFPSTPAADSETLLRRLNFDLVGLPPTPEEIARFKEAHSNNEDFAIANKVDELLGRPGFGERWGRHWLDIARYAESNGKETNVPHPHAWRYRDYVIDAFNADKPYDRFLSEQIAGDLLPYQNYAQQAEQITATGFLALGAKSLNERNPAQFLLDVADEQIDTLTRAVLGTTVACARCHDHKFDPIPTEDYYALAGIFLSSDTYYGTTSGPGRVRESKLLRLPDVPGQLITDPDISIDGMASLREERAALERQAGELRQAAFAARRMEEAPEPDIRNLLRIRTRIGQIEAKLETIDDNGRAFPLAMGAWEGTEISDTNVLRRGELDQPGQRVARGFPRFVSLQNPPRINPNQSGRLDLAQWITAPDHPLTARVFVNRIWQHLFGRGIVASVDNFGTTGELPSHPELLDYLACTLIEDGWSTKSMIRRIVLSGTYRQASHFDEQCFHKDPENTLLWRMSKRRLEAEAIRDAMLAAAGTLNMDRPSGSPVSRLNNITPARLLASGQLESMTHNQNRSVYLPVIRDSLPDALDVFDFAEASLVTGARDATITPGQALYMLNNPFVQDCAADLGHRLLEQETGSREQLALGHLLCYGRPPTPEEIDIAARFYDDFLTRADTTSHLNPRLLALHSYCQALFASAEFRYLD
jgi:hypothetical protein